MIPSEVQTGWLKGCRETAQKLKGSLRKLAPGTPFFAWTPEPALAENWSPDDHYAM